MKVMEIESPPDYLSVAELIEILQHQPPNAMVHAYEGEGIGLVVCTPHKMKELAWIHTPTSGL